MTRVLVLVAAGIGSGLSGSIAGLASLISYPVLLALGLPPVTANVTNTVALVFSSSGSISASRLELRGQGRRIRQLASAGLAGGVVGAALLLLAPAGSFEAIVPWLIALASVAILARRRIETTDVQPHRASKRLVVGTAIIGVYSGYFGAGAGVMLLALFLFVTGEPLPRANAAKNVVLGVANGVAALGFALFGHVRWSFVAPLGLGLFIGGRLGPTVVRRARTGPLRIVIALAGLGLASKLAFDAYR